MLSKTSFRLAAALLLAAIFSSCVTRPPIETVPQKPAGVPEAVSPQWQPFAPDATNALDYFSGKIIQPRLEFFAVRADLFSLDLQITVSGGDGGRSDAAGTFLSMKVSSFVRNCGLLAGINALPFDPVSGKEGEPRANVGLVISDGVMLSPPHPTFDALVFYASGHAAIVPQSQVSSVQGIANAAGGFRQILVSGHLSEAASRKERHPRSAAGISADAQYLYLLVIDGRRPGSIGSTQAETAVILKQLGAYNGINFDGGGSSALALRYPDGQVRVVNTPIHSNIPGTERAVAGCLGVKCTPNGRH